MPRVHWFCAAMLAVALTLAPVARAQVGAGARTAPSGKSGALPTLGDGSDLGSSAERRLGDRIARELYRDPDYLDDPVLREYVDDIWRPLLAAARNRGELANDIDQRFAWQILLGRDRSVNAFALPGGYLGLHLGLIGVVTSRDELASVLAHELSHVTQRHIARQMAKQSAQTPWMIGSMILGVLAASKSPDAANALMVGGQAAAMQNQLNFSRDMEREADRIGFGVMTDAGFSAQGFVSMFDKLQQAAKLNDNGAFPYLRSHPLTTERIADMRARQPLGSPVAGAEMETDHAMVSARARILSNPGVDTLRQTVAEALVPPAPGASLARQAATLYAATLAAVRLRDFDAARASGLRLSTLVASNPAATRLTALLAVELAQAAGQPVPELPAKGRPEMLLSAQSLVAQGRAREAAADLQAWVALHPLDAGAWQGLASASAAQGQPLRALRAQAEARAAQLDYAGALDRLKAAQTMVRSARANNAGDHIEASIIDTRSRQLQSLLREQALER